MKRPGTKKLAIDGGRKVRESPWPARRLLGEEEKRAVIALLDKAMASSDVCGYNGEQEEAYCNQFARSLGGGYADAVNSGTSAVYVALRALEIEPFTEVIVPPITDPGGVMPVPLMNCVPVPADAAPGSYNAGPEQVRDRITRQTSAILVAHIAGIPCDMDGIMDVARSAGLPVIEDCAQAHGALYRGRAVGTIGDVAAFSTMFGKHHATGGQGGVVFTKDEHLYWRAKRLADRGKPFGLEGVTSNIVASLNLNSSELAMALGREQLKKLPGMVEARRRVALSIAAQCESLRTVRMVSDPPECKASFWFLFFRVDLARIRVGKEQFVAALAAEGLPVGASYLHTPVLADWYRNRAVFGTSGYPWACPLYKGDRNKQYELPNAMATDACHFTMNIHEGCGEQEVADTIAALRKVEAAYAS